MLGRVMLAGLPVPNDRVAELAELARAGGAHDLATGSRVPSTTASRAWRSRSTNGRSSSQRWKARLGPRPVITRRPLRVAPLGPTSSSLRFDLGGRLHSPNSLISCLGGRLGIWLAKLRPESTEWEVAVGIWDDLEEIGEDVVDAAGDVGDGLVDAASSLFDGPGQLIGIATAGAALFVVGPGAVIPAFLAGAAAGNALIRHRHMTDDGVLLSRCSGRHFRPTIRSFSPTCLALKEGSSLPQRDWSGLGEPW